MSSSKAGLTALLTEMPGISRDICHDRKSCSQSSRVIVLPSMPKICMSSLPQSACTYPEHTKKR